MAKEKVKDEVEDIEELDLEELADTEEPTAAAEETGDEEAKPKTRAASTKPEKTGIGTKELAEALSTSDKTISGRELRVMLRDKEANTTERFAENRRYKWDSVEQALSELGFDDLDEAREALAQSRAKRLEALKEKVGEKREKEKKEKEEKE